MRRAHTGLLPLRASSFGSQASSLSSSANVCRPLVSTLGLLRPSMTTPRARALPHSRLLSTSASSSELIMGIDLGTTNSCVAIIEDGKPRVLDNVDSGKSTTPSVVAFTKDRSTGSHTMLVGDAARRQAVLNPRNTIYGTKRLIGRRFDSPEVQKIKAHVPYEIVKATNGTGDAWVKADGKAYSPSQIGAFVLSKMKETAEKHVGKGLSKAVITVPAYFNDSQRQATKDAGAIAGLDVLRIINEPTAASLAYGFSGEEKGRQTIAVYDLGGGTFDISILELDKGSCQVVATNGDTFLGGEDFDELVLQHLLREFKNKEGIDLSGDVYAIQRLREAAEKAKKDLDHVPQVEINLPFITQTKNFSQVLTKSKFEDLIRPLIEKSIAPCKAALKDAGIKQVDNVILVGGMTRTPAVQQKVSELFGIQPSKGVNPDEVVAVGAAIQGGVLNKTVTSMILMDVTPLSLGVNTKGDIFSRIIKRNSSIPCSNTQTYVTSADGQREVNFDLLQGEREIASKNHLLGRMSLPVMPAPKGVAKVDVTFSIDVNGIVHVTARDPALNKVASVRLQASGGLNERDIERMLRDAEKQKEHDARVRESAEKRNEAESLIRSAEEYIENDVLTQSDKEELREKVRSLQELLDKPMDDPSAGPDQLMVEFSALNDAVMGIGQKIYKGSAGPVGDTGDKDDDEEEGGKKKGHNH